MERQRKRSASSAIDDGCGGCFSFRGKQPGPKVQVSDADALMAKEMNSLSLDERAKVFEDIHAVPRPPDEDPDAVGVSLTEMAICLDKIKKKSAYDKAFFLCPDYVENSKFRLMFLRSEHFDSKRAARRFVNHFERKLELFGSERLARDIEFDDLTSDDKSALFSGSIQFLPLKDRSDRTVCCNAHKYHSYKHWTNHMRVLWYLAMWNLTDHEDIQRFGLVLIAYCVGPFDMAEFDRDMLTNAIEYCGAIPMRYSALHYCFDDPKLRPIISFSRLLVDTSTRLRFRAHFGSHLECQYELATYGIPRKILPVDTSGSLLLDVFIERIDQKRALEESMRRADTTVRPGKHDVLLGRGRPYQEYEGNLQLAEIVDLNRSRYRAGGRGQKSVISEELVKEIQKLGGRFLKKTQDGRSWVEVSDEVARDKVGHGFRTKTRRNANAEQE